MRTSINIAVTAITVFAGSQAQASVIINEIDYDQPGSDLAEFIELFNTGAADISLDGYHLDLINGSTGSSYRSIDLAGHTIAAGDYLVLCSDSLAVMNCGYQFTTTSGWLQNGAPDGIGLYSGSGLTDSMTYEGEIVGFTEGETLFLEDSNAETMSLARIPDGTDTNSNFSDFRTACITPGSANIAGSGDCSTPAVSPVPVPAALWLFSSGLLGLAGIARRHDRSGD